MSEQRTGYQWVKRLPRRNAVAAVAEQMAFIGARIYTPDEDAIYAADCEYLRVLAARAGLGPEVEQFLAEDEA